MLKLLVSLAGAIVLGGCASGAGLSSLTTAAETASSIGHIKPSKADTCETQKQVAAQSSKIDTIVTGKETVYKATCSEQSRTEQSRTEGRAA